MVPFAERNKYHERYVNQATILDDVKANLLSRLNKMERSEIEFQKDVSEFTTEEIRKALKDLRFDNVLSLNAIRLTCDSYTDWCVEQKYTAENNFKNISIDDIYSYVKQTEIITENELLWIREDLLNPSDRVIFELQFFGIKSDVEQNELDSIKPESLDTKNNIIHLPTRDLEVPNYVIHDIQESFEAKYYYYELHGREYKFEVTGNGIVKFRNSKNTSQGSSAYYIANKFSRMIVPKYGYKYKRANVKRSGIVYFTKKMLLKYHVKDVMSIWDNQEFKKEVRDRFNIGGSNPSTFNQVYRMYYSKEE